MHPVATCRLDDNSAENLLTHPEKIRDAVLKENKQIINLCRCDDTVKQQARKFNNVDTVNCEPAGNGDICAKGFAKQQKKVCHANILK